MVAAVAEPEPYDDEPEDEMPHPTPPPEVADPNAPADMTGPLAKHFSWKEGLRSTTAERLGIANVPNAGQAAMNPDGGGLLQAGAVVGTVRRAL